MISHDDMEAEGLTVSHWQPGPFKQPQAPSQRQGGRALLPNGSQERRLSCRVRRLVVPKRKW